MTSLWESGTYSLSVIENVFVISKDGQRILTYNDNIKKWFGKKRDSRGNIILIEWPTFQDIINQYEKRINGELN